VKCTLVDGIIPLTGNGELMLEKKKVAAVLAAVSLYLQEEAAAVEGEQTHRRELARAECSPWGQSARQEMMAMRRLLQLRAFARF
jgi:hypothetical protein